MISSTYSTWAAVSRFYHSESSASTSLYSFPPVKHLNSEICRGSRQMLRAGPAVHGGGDVLCRDVV